MFLECDELVVNKDEWELCKNGDKKTIEQLRKKFKGMFLYSHALSVNADEVVCVTAREFNEVVMGDRMTLVVGILDFPS